MEQPSHQNQQTYSDMQIKELFFHLLSTELSEVSSAPEAFDQSLLKQVYALAVRHQLSHLISSALSKVASDGALPDPKHKKEVLSAIMRSRALENETKKIKAALTKAEIPFILLKGAVTKKLYPESWMRSSRDIDLLLPKERHEEGCLVLCDALSYSVMEKGTHDIELKTPQGLCVELHFSLLEKNIFPKAAEWLDGVWNRAVQTEDDFHFQMADIDFYFFHLVHMAKHFKNGGCGIRPLVDLWLFCRQDYRSDELTKLLSECGLLSFTQVMESLCQAWFSKGEYTDVLRLTEDYLLNGGLSGDESVFYIDTVRKHKNKSKYLLSRIFIPYKELKKKYPSLEGRPLLYPYYYLKRMWELLFGKRKEEGRAQLKNISDASAERVSVLDAVFSNAGL